MKRWPALILALALPAASAEPAFDPLAELFTRDAPTDEAAAKTSPERGEALARLTADLTLAAQGLEAFRSPDDTTKALKYAPERVPAELRPRFSSREQALDTLYRTLAVADYTWATRFPDEKCSASDRRTRLLSSADGLFKDSTTGQASPWLVHLLGPDAAQNAETALDKASAAEPAKGRAYELLRAKAAKITAALAAAPEDKRAWLHCLRAETYETLARANQVETGPITASRGTIPSRGVALIGKLENGVFEAYGSGVVLKTKNGERILTDSRLVQDETDLQAVFSDTGKPIKVRVERKGPELAILSSSDDLGEGRELSANDPIKDDMVTVVSNSERLGAWAWTQGLVSDSQDGIFQTDAVVDAGQAGGAVLDENGRVAGLLTLQDAVAEDGEGLWPVGVPASKVKAWLEGGELRTASRPVALQDAGTASIIQASYIYSNTQWGSVRGKCVANCGGSSSYSRGYSSNPGAEALGRAMGEAIGQGVRALFKGLGSMFRSKGEGFAKRAPKPSRTVTKPERPKPAETPKAPRKEPPLPSLELKMELTVQDTPDAVHFTARVTSNRPDAKLGNLTVDFEVNGSTKAWAKTNEAGYAFLTVVKPRAQKAHDDLDAESVRHPWLTNASNKSDRQSYCEVTLLGAATVVGAVAVLRAPMAVPVAGGALISPATRPQAVKACQTIVQGATAAAAAACGAFIGGEVAKSAAPNRRTPEAMPPERDRSRLPPVRLNKHAVEMRSEIEHEDLNRMEREITGESGEAGDESATGQPADPNEEPPDDETTLHGKSRIAGENPGRGGTLSRDEITATKSGKLMKQSDGAKVYIHEASPGKYNVVIQGERGIITTFKNLSYKAIERLGRRYGWE